MSGSANDGSGGNRMNDGNVRGGAAGGWSIGRWVLLLSLALNVALGAALLLPLVAADHYRGQRSGHSHGGDHMPSPRQLRRLLGEEREAVVDAVFEKHRPALRETFRPLHAARGAVHAAMHAEPFDRAALDAAFAELRERDAATAAAVQAMLAEVIAQLTPDERARIAASMEKRERERQERWKKRRETRRDKAAAQHRAPSPL